MLITPSLPKRPSSFSSTLSFSQFGTSFNAYLTEKSIFVVAEEKGLGEIAPLGGRSRETLHQAWRELQEGDYGSPSVAFGIDSAHLNLIQPLPPFSLFVNALLSGSPEEILEQAKFSKQKRYTHVKVKVGHLTPKEAYPLLQHLKNQFRLRIDVNRLWKTNDALTLFSQFAPQDFDYVEEPLDDNSALENFPLPFALDESLQEDVSLDYTNLTTLILKPTLLGNLATCQKWCTLAKERNLQVVLTHACEGPIGRYNVATFVKRLKLPNIPMGLA